MKILFISRAYPPVWGGVEMQNFGLAQSLSKITETKIIANTKGKKFLPIFLPWVTLRSLILVHNYDVVLFGDGVLAPVGVFLSFFYPKKKYISVIHGLDITFAHKKSLLGKIYRAINIPSIKKLDELIMVGNETINQAEILGISRKKCIFIPNGLYLEEICTNNTRQDLAKLLEIDLTDKKIMFRGGRIVKHKGVEWFIRNVMPHLPENYILVVAGGAVAKTTVGDENNYPNCKKAAEELHLENRVKFFINLDRESIKILFNTCDIFVQPNIKVPGSMEGFGITAIEAAACQRVVLASNIEGLKDAVKDNENGILAESGNADIWIKKTKEILENDQFRITFGKKAQEFIRNNFTWERISKRYLEEMEKVNKN